MIKESPLVSVIVTTKNNAGTLEACLKSIKEQSYRKIELLVVDNNSNDETKKIADKYSDRLFNKGPERSAQRNFGVEMSTGDWVLIIDSDMELTLKVVAACVEKIEKESDVKGIIIPEESFGIGFWAKCKRLEKSFYVGVDWIEAARFFDRHLYKKLGGYDTSMYAGEDWDLSQRVGQKYQVSRISEYIRHNEGHINLWKTLGKKYHYAKNAKVFLKANKVESKMSHPTGPVQRYKLFFSKPGKLLKNPVVGTGMLFMKFGEYLFGGIGYLKSKNSR
jgi:glycosyltransferase involved in cell wall biosynthesis